VAVIDPRKLLVELHARRDAWKPVRLMKADDPIVMPEFGLACQVADLYRGTALDPQRNARLTEGPLSGTRPLARLRGGR
jgi:hypothetical protein